MAKQWRFLNALASTIKTKLSRPLAGQIYDKPFEGVEPAGRGFEPLYSGVEHENLPWFWPNIDPDFEAALKYLDDPPQRVLDVGTGSGIQAVELAKRGYDTSASDFSAAALEFGKTAARKGGVSVNFHVDDVCSSRLIGQKFDAVFDRGCFHILPPVQRVSYFETVKQLLPKNAFLFLKCFSNEEPPRPGPFRFSAEEIKSFFNEAFRLIEIRPTEFHGARPVHPKAIFAVLQRK